VAHDLFVRPEIGPYGDIALYGFNAVFTITVILLAEILPKAIGNNFSLAISLASSRALLALERMSLPLLLLLERVMPERFGGVPSDYQLVEGEGSGQTEIELRVNPRLGLPSEDEVKQFSISAQQSLDENMRMQHISMSSSMIVATLLMGGTAALYWLGSLHVMSGALSVTSLIAITNYLALLYQPIDSITSVGWDLERAAGSARRCFEVLDHTDDVADKPGAKEIKGTRGELVFEDVSFGYTTERNIIEHVNLKLPPGQTVAFVGTTGAGKSTLLSLVPRFYDPTGGRVLLDGMDLRDLSKKSLRAQISIVLQDTLLFSTTVRENIAYGRPGATEQEIIEAAKRAQAHDFIMAMPNGYSSQVGERGGHLSVGQRQRIGIARAFLKNAPILLLDEPTSALDPTTESAIMQTIEGLMQGRTTLIITHRLATIHNMDKIVVLGPGGVVEEGRGPELVKRGGFYANLYHSANLGHQS
jgi:ATP-binding cassette subfamily B protein/subfamily B ATP-binding cassette protein MsbA